MKKEDVFDALRTILDQSGMSELISLSTQKYESADFCVIDDDYLGLHGIRTVPFACIDRISYSAGEENLHYRYPDGLLQIVFKLRGDVHFVYESGDQGDFYWVSAPNSDLIENPSEVQAFFKEYNADHDIQRNLCDELQRLPFFEEEKKDLALRAAAAWKKEAFSYIESHPDCVDRDEVIFNLLCAALYARVMKNGWVRENCDCNDYDAFIELLPVEELVSLLASKSKMIAFFKYARASSIMAQFEDICTEAETIVLELLQKSDNK